MNRPVVVKIGGSLADCLPTVVEAIRSSGRPAVIVPGGGVFADTVRKTAVSASAAHWMAVAAMETYGWMIAALGVRSLSQLRVPGEMSVLLPYCLLRERDPLPHTWNVTSDTIAAWFACELGLECILLKSVDGIYRDGRLLSQVSKPLGTDVVDPCLIPFSLKRGVRTTLINGRVPERLTGFLNGSDVPCTVIDTRL